MTAKADRQLEQDVSFAWTEFEHEAIASATIASFGAVKAPMAQPEDLIAEPAVRAGCRDGAGTSRAPHV